ncbi:MAG TPA: mannonate dehydratase [Opitutales bacterium]|nr:mannonate dehydratase [Opitutales bacterium]
MNKDALLKECFRWYGPNDTVTLQDIVQCGCTGVYTSLHHIPYGEVWPREEIRKRLDQLAPYGLEWTAVESVPVSEAIRTRTGDYKRHLENYRQTLENLGAEGVKIVIYNFMPALDWVRTDLAYKLPDGSQCLFFDPAKFAAFDMFLLKRPGAEKDFTPEQIAKAKAFFDGLDDAGKAAFEKAILDVFPGVKMGVTIESFRAMLAKYDGIDEKKLREHYKLFLEAVVPSAEKAGVRLAVHPDDPPFPILGLARIASVEADFRQIVSMVPSPANGICFCTGSLSARAANDLPGMIERLGDHIACFHFRSVQRNPDGTFFEANHLEGCANLPAVMTVALKLNAKRDAAHKLSVRPDHGHRILDDLKKPVNANPGYDCLGRMKGLAELRGLQTGIAFTMGDKL